MKKEILAIIFVFLPWAIQAQNAEPPVNQVNIDLKKSRVIWKGYKLAGSHDGIVKFKRGNLYLTDGELTGGTLTADLANLEITDLKGSSAKKLGRYLKSENFFDIEKYPTAQFEITEVDRVGKSNKYNITGRISLKNVTRTIRFKALQKIEEGMISFTANLTIDRNEFGIRAVRGFSKVTDKMIYDEFDVEIRLFLKQ